VAPFLYRCPNTGYRVQGLIAEDVSDEIEGYRAIKCLACQQAHLVNPTTGKILGDADDE
jgi:hypothetical protein